MTANPLPDIDGQLASPTPGSPLAALNAFYRAFNDRDVAATERQWVNDAAVSMSNPLGGIARGWPAIRAVYERIFGGPAVVRVAFHDYTLHGGRLLDDALQDSAGTDFFYAVGRERGTLQRDDTRLELAIRTSRLYRLIDGDWRQVHHHGSFEDPALFEAYREAVRA